MTTTRTGTPRSDKAALWAPATFAGHDFDLLKVDDTAWIAITPLCATLGISGATQERRLRRHAAASGLRLRTVRGRETDDVWVAIELLELKWFLRTLRPTGPAARGRLDFWRGALVEFLVDYWYRYHGPLQLKRVIRARMKRTERSPTAPPPSRRKNGGVTRSVATRIRALRESGLNLRAIATDVGYSRTTVCQVLNGKYPCIAPDDSVADGPNRKVKPI